MKDGNVQVAAAVERGVIVLTLNYDRELLFETTAPKLLSDQLLEQYRATRKDSTVKTDSCIVEMKTEVAGSPVVRALSQLWREVVAGKAGQVVCVNYPHQYIDSLTTLGLLGMDGFALANTREEALNRLAPRAEEIGK